MTDAEQHVASLIYAALDEWDRVHADGWNEPYMKLVPSAFHLAARNICAAYGLTACPQAAASRS